MAGSSWLLQGACFYWVLQVASLQRRRHPFQKTKLVNIRWKTLFSSDSGLCMFLFPCASCPAGKDPNNILRYHFLESCLVLGVHNTLLSLPFPWEKPIRSEPDWVLNCRFPSRMKGTAVVIYLARKGKAPVLAPACNVSSLQWWQLAFPGRVGDSKAFNEGQVAARCVQTQLHWLGWLEDCLGCCIYVFCPFLKGSAALSCNPTAAVGGWCEGRKVLRALIPTAGLCKDLLESELKWAFRRTNCQLLADAGAGLLFSLLSGENPSWQQVLDTSPPPRFWQLSVCLHWSLKRWQTS